MLRRSLVRCLAGSTLLLVPVAVMAQGSNAAIFRTREEKRMHASGTFEVKVTPVEPSDVAKAANTGRMTIDKTWTGGMIGTSKGEMLTGITQANGSMAYVAMERFTGTVDGHEGTLLFQHRAVMVNGKALPGDPDVQVVPGSGTGALKEIAGKLEILIEGGVHQYNFAYTLPGQQ